MKVLLLQEPCALRVAGLHLAPAAGSHGQLQGKRKVGCDTVCLRLCSLTGCFGPVYRRHQVHPAAVAVRSVLSSWVTHDVSSSSCPQLHSERTTSSSFSCLQLYLHSCCSGPRKQSHRVPAAAGAVRSACSRATPGVSTVSCPELQGKRKVGCDTTCPFFCYHPGCFESGK